MTVRGANYPRKENDFYSTPPETTRVLLDRTGFRKRVCDPACGQGAVLKVLEKYEYDIVGADLVTGYDFLTDEFHWPGYDLVTNPPFGTGGRTAVKFIERALEVTQSYRGKIAMLLPVDFDSGATRVHLFGGCPVFAMKITLLNRIRWFNNQSGSINHAWFVWDWKHKGLPTICYAKQKFEKYLLT